jgi:hypothetical protein
MLHGIVQDNLLIVRDSYLFDQFFAFTYEKAKFELY